MAKKVTKPVIVVDSPEPTVRYEPNLPVQYIALADIDIVRNTRTSYDPVALEGLAQNVTQYGVLQNILLRPHPETPGRYQLAAGHRRYLASQMAGLPTIPAGIREMTDHEFLELQVLENLHRENIHPADEAAGFAELLANNFSAEEIAARVCKPVRFVLQRAKLASLVPFWMQALREGRLPLVAAHELARLPETGQEQATLMKNEFGGTANDKTVYQADRVNRWISQEIMRDLTGAAFPKDDATLNPAMGACTTCPHRTGAYQQLFEEHVGKDCCLNAGCFALKKQVFVERKAREMAEQQGKAPLRVSEEYSSKKPGVAGRYDYDTVKKTTPGAVEALMVDGPNAGAVQYVRLNSRGKAATAPLEDLAAAKDAKKAEDAARIRANRLKRVANELLAEQLRDRFMAGLEQNGNDARQLLVHFTARAITYGVSKATEATLEYLVRRYGFDKPAGPDLSTQYRSSEPTLHEQYLRRQLARLDVSVLVVLYFDLKFRERMQDEQYDTQRSLAKHLPGGVPDVAAEAEQLLVLRFYTQRPRSVAVEELSEVISEVMGEGVLNA